jgi:hypothetical protein
MCFTNSYFKHIRNVEDYLPAISTGYEKKWFDSNCHTAHTRERDGGAARPRHHRRCCSPRRARLPPTPPPPCLTPLPLLPALPLSPPHGALSLRRLVATPARSLHPLPRPSLTPRPSKPLNCLQHITKSDS